MDATTFLTALRDAPLSAIVALLIAWLIHRVFVFLEGRRADDRFVSIRGAQETLHNNMIVIASEIHSQHTDKMQLEEKQLNILERIEAHLITAGATVKCPRSGEADCAESDYRMPASSQRNIIRYQWCWGRDEVVSVLDASIRKNGIQGNQNVIARRVFQSCRNALAEAKGSLDRLVGISYPYADLFSDTTELLMKVWDLAIPLYHREIVGSLDCALDDFAFRVEGIFEETVQRHFLKYDDDPSTNTYRKEDSRSGEWDTVSQMAEKLLTPSGVHPDIKSALEAKETPPGAPLDGPEAPDNQEPPEGASDKEHENA